MLRQTLGAVALIATFWGYPALTAQQPRTSSKEVPLDSKRQSTYLPPVHIAPRRESNTLPADQRFSGVFSPQAAQPVRQHLQTQNSDAPLPRKRVRRENNGIPDNQPANRQVQATTYGENLRQSGNFEQQGAHTRAASNEKSILNTASHKRTGNPSPPLPDESTAWQQPVRTISAQGDELDAQFAELEKPIERLSQTPAPLETRPFESDRQTKPGSSSVLSEDSQDPLNIPSRPASKFREPAPAADYPALPLENLPSNNSLRGNSDPNWNAHDDAGDFIESDLSQDAMAPSQATLSCDELRRRLLSEPITQIALDLSPPLPKRTDELPPRPAGEWTDFHGRVIASGKLVELSRGYAIIETAEGPRKIPFSQLGDASLAQIAAAWQIPAECAVGLGSYSGRCWTPQLVTWYASNLCHKPLYFEDEQLERYGHSAGPMMGPLRSTAHFFVDAAFLPYKTAINPPNECIYSLGFYRPGNCAPWLKDPFPISLSGAARQGALLSGFFFMF